MAAHGAAADQEESGPLVFQRGKKLNDEYYIVSVRDNAESACVRFAAYELESSETYELAYSYVDFDALFKAVPDLANPGNKEGRFDWVVDRLDFTTSNGGAKRLTLASDPTAEDESPDSNTVAGLKMVPKDRLTFAERTRLRAEAEKLEDKRAANIALKSEKNRKAFVGELTEKRKLEELKAAARRQRIDEERSERRENQEMQRRINEEKQKRFEVNEKKREERIVTLVDERRRRDLEGVKEVKETDRKQKEGLEAKLSEARVRKQEAEDALLKDEAAKKLAEAALEEKRASKISERSERLKQAEKEYLDLRQKKIEDIAVEQSEKNKRKSKHLQERATQRAQQLKEKHAKLETWEALEDGRTQSNMKKEHARDMLMLDHVDRLRQKHTQEEAEAAARKQAATQDRQEREVREAEEQAEALRRRSELEQKRNRNVATLEAKREQGNQAYCEKIRDQSTAEALKTRDQQNLVVTAREKNRERRIEARHQREEQENSAAIINAQRDENVHRRENERDAKFAAEVRASKDLDRQKQQELEAKKIEKRLRDKEMASKHQEMEKGRKQHLTQLEDKREAMVRERAFDRDRREQDRMRGAPSDAAGAPAAPAAEAAAN